MVQPSSPLQPGCELWEASSIHNTCRWGPILQGWWIHGMVLCQCSWPARNGTWCFDLQIPHRNYPRKMDAESFRPLDESQNNVFILHPNPGKGKVKLFNMIFCLVWKYLGKLYRCRLNFRKPDPTIAHLEVRSNVNAVIAKLASWSIKVASLGIGPAMGFHGEMFTKGSSRYKLVGKTLANGWKYLAPYIECKVL